MGRDNSWQFRMQEREREKRKRVNPIWRGVGCLLLVSLALGAFFFGGWFLDQNQTQGWVYLPPEVIRPPFLAAWPPFLFARLILAGLALVLGFGAIGLIYAIAFPVQLGETDAPPMKRERRRPR